MDLQQIQNLNLEDTFFTILNRLVDFSVIPEGESQYTIDSNEELSMYDRVTLHELLTKPTLQAMEDELVIYKQELTDEENARLVEVARLYDLKSRWETLRDRDYGMPAYYQTISDKPNYAVYFRDEILGEADHALAESRLATIETKDAELVTDIADNAWLEGRRKRYREESDPLYIEAAREKELGDSTKWDIYITLINNIKTEFPKP